MNKAAKSISEDPSKKALSRVHCTQAQQEPVYLGIWIIAGDNTLVYTDSQTICNKLPECSDRAAGMFEAFSQRRKEDCTLSFRFNDVTKLLLLFCPDVGPLRQSLALSLNTWVRAKCTQSSFIRFLACVAVYHIVIITTRWCQSPNVRSFT